MTFSDIFKSSFLNNVTAVSPLDMVLALGLSFCLGLFIFYVYKKTYSGVMFSSSFGVTLIAMTMITALVILAISSNVVLSLGMVGALSIVRFRTAIKEPLDTCYMFWAITMGILLGAQQYAIALVVVVGIGAILILLSFVRFRNPNAYLLVVHYDLAAEQDIETELRRGARSRRIRSKTVTRSGAEMTVEVRLDNRTDIVRNVLAVAGVHDATLVACQNETGA